MIKRERGFTLIELMITLVIGMILLTIAMPSFKSMTDNTRLATSANNLVMAMLIARSEAVKTGLEVYVAPLTAADGWGGGYIVGFDLDGDGDYSSLFSSTSTHVTSNGINDEELRRFEAKGNLNFESDIDFVTYFADGTVELNTEDITDVISLQASDCEDGMATKRRELEFENTGQVRVVSKDCEAV